MNPFFVIILVAILFDYAINLVADILNLGALKLEIPRSLQGIYRTDEYRKSQQYTRSNTRFGFVTSSYRLAVLLAFWFAGGFNFLDQIIRSWGFIPIANGLLYIGILLLVYSLITLPFNIYKTFVIEERFGFNRTTPATYIKDILKSLALAVILGGPLLAIVLALFEYAGNYAWLYCWLATTVISLGIEYIAPTWIMPLFNKFTPMETGELKNAILQYADSVRFPVKNVLVMDGSKRSSKSNAFFTGFGSNKRIALFDTLIEKQSVGELVAILAHEIGHYKKKHVLQGTIVSIIHVGIILFLLSVFMGSPGLYEVFYMDQPSIYTGLLFFGLLYTPVEMILSLALQIISRKYEYQADRFAVLTSEEPKNLTSALKKLSADHLSNLTPHPFYVFLNYSHPPLLQRLEALKKKDSA